MSLTITRKRTGSADVEINARHKTLKITRELERGHSCQFKTEDDVQEWDEIIIEDGASNTIFAGIVHEPELQTRKGIETTVVNLKTYKKLFDRLLVAKSYEDKTFGFIVADIISTFCPGFTSTNVDTGPTIAKAVFNYEKPSNAIKSLCEKIGYTWKIDFEKDVHAFPVAAGTKKTITDTSGDFEDLKVKPNVQNFSNVVVVRGGAYLSSQQTVSFKGDGERTAFFTPEKPRETEVWVNSVQKTLGVKFGENTPTTDFVVNYAESAIENGTHAVLSSSDIIEIKFKFDVPLRLIQRRIASITAMEAILGSGNGEFQSLIEDDTLNTRELARQVAQAHLDAYSNALVNGSFSSEENEWEEGQVINIQYNSFTAQAVIKKVVSQNLGGELWKNTVSFSTVLFDFEEFLRQLIASGRVAVNDGEIVEVIYEFGDEAGFDETVTIETDTNRQEDEMGVADSFYSEKNASIQFVYGPYLPTSHTDAKRVFVLDASPLG